jgi:glycosyltransferase involved in cell wall biosynthesis
MDTQEKTISVCIITYNHEKFIVEAIESVLVQQTQYSYEIVIADDASRDNTRAILQDYSNRYPGKFKLVLQEKNIGPGNNFIDLLKAANGKYIAYFEGDDYWTDPLKLEKQVDFMEKNPEYTLTFHNVSIVDEHGKQTGMIYPPGRKKVIDFSDLANGDFTKTCSCIFLNDKLRLEAVFNGSITPDDSSLYMRVVEDGKGYYFEDVMAVYRVHQGGVWSQQKNIFKLRNSLTCLQSLLRFYRHKPERKYFRQQINATYVQLGINYLMEKQYKNGIASYIKSLKFFNLRNTRLYFASVKTALKGLFVGKQL